MSYTKHNYQKGDELLASQLNEMDDQIALNEQTADTLVTVSNTQPSQEKNRVWVKSTPSEVEIPTMEDHNELSRQLSDVESDFDDIVIKSTNLYDQNAITNGYACKAGQTTGQAAGTDVVATHSISDWISVEPETSYIIWIDIETTGVNYRRQFADNSLNLVADFGTVTNGAAFITPAGCTKFRFSAATETMTTKKIQLEKGSQKTHYEDFGYTLKCDDELSLTSKAPVQNKVLTEEFIKVRNENVSVFQGVGRIEKFCHVNTQGNVVFDAEILIHGRNLYNSSTSTSGYAVKAGQLIGDQAETEIVAPHSVSDWISVDPETTYTLKETDGFASTYRVQFADIQHVLVANQGTIVNGTSFTTPAGCTQMRFSTATTTMTGKTQLEKGTTATEYEEYRTSFNPDYLTEILAMFNDPSIVRNSLAGKTAVFNGDSILELPYNWGKLMCEHFGIPYVHTGTDKTNFAIGGSTLTVWAGTGEAPRDRTPLIERYMDMPNNMDMVIISIGTNDWYYSWSDIGNRTDAWNVSFKGALNALLVGYTANSVTNEGLLDKYIGKNIIFVTPIKRDSNPNRTNTFGKTLEDYAEAIKDVCGYYGIPVIDMFHECPLNPSIPSQKAQFFDGSLNVAEGYPNLYNDDVHPNVFGSRVQARQAIGYMQAVYGWNVLKD